MTERINFWRIHDLLSPYGRPKTLLNKITDKLKTFFVPSWFDDFLEMQLTVENAAEVDDVVGKFRSCDGVCFQNEQIVTPETISSGNEPKVQHHLSDEPSLPNDGVQSSQLSSKPGRSIDTNASINNAEFHQSGELGNTETMSCRGDAFLKYLMDPYGDPMSVMPIYDHYSGICNNRKYRQEPARLLPSRNRLKTPEISVDKDFPNTVQQFKISSSRPTTKKSLYDYFTTLPMTRTSKENAFTLAAKKRRTKQFRNAFVLCRRKMKARRFKDNGTPVISSYSKRILKTLDKINPRLSDQKGPHPDEQVSSCELNQEKVTGQATESIPTSASPSLPSTSVASSIQENAISSLPATEERDDDDDDDDDDNDNDDYTHEEQSITWEANSVSPEMSQEESAELEISSQVPEMPKEESITIEPNFILPEILKEGSVEVERDSIYSAMPKEEPIALEPNQILPKIPTKESVELQPNFILPDIPSDESITPEQNAIVPKMLSSSSGKNLSDEKEFTETSPPRTSLPYLLPSYSNTTHTQVEAPASVSPNLLNFPITNSSRVSTQNPNISSDFKSILPSEEKDLIETSRQPLQSLSESAFPEIQLQSSRGESPMDWCEMTPPATPMEIPPSCPSRDTLQPCFMPDENIHKPFPCESLSTAITSTLPAGWNILPTIPHQESPYPAATHFPTPQFSSVRTEDPMDCSEITPQTTAFSSTPFNSSNTIHTEMSSALQTHPGPFNIFNQNTNNLRFITQSSHSPFNSTYPSQWNVSPATPKQLFPSSPAAQFPTPHNSRFTTEDPMDCSEIAPQTTSFSNPVISPLNTTCTVVPFAIPTPLNSFNVFSQNANNDPVSSTSSSIFQSNNILSAAPIELPEVPRQAKSWTRPFLKAKKKTSTQSSSASNTVHCPFIFSQNMNISFSSSQLYSSSSHFTSNLPATRHFSPTTPQATSSSASAAHFSIVQRSRFSTTTSPVLPSGRNPFAATPLSQDVPRLQQPRVTILPKTGRRRRSGADY